MKKKKGMLILLDGPSGVGKSTVVSYLLNHPKYKFKLIKKITTRKKRANDKEERNIKFVSEEKFKKMIRNKEFLEYKHFKFGMSYGLSLREISQIINNGYNAIGIINLGKAKLAKSIYPSSIIIFINSPLALIEKRIRNRGVHTKEQTQERLDNARKAIKILKDSKEIFDYVIDNSGNLSALYKKVDKVIKNILIRKERNYDK